MRLIIADDNEGFAQMCAEVARRAGWDVTQCADGRALLALLDRVDAPTLVLCDIGMPELDGIEVIRNLPENMLHHLRFRFVTGGAASNALAARLIAKARDISVGRYLSKPVSIADLRKMLDEEAKALADQQIS